MNRQLYRPPSGKEQFLQFVVLAIAAAVVIALMAWWFGRARPTVPPRAALHAPEFPFEHPAAEEVRRIDSKLLVYSEEDYRRLPRRDRYMWDVSWFEAEVMNGGFDQFLYNYDHPLQTLEALEAIGATKSHRLLKTACDFFPQGRPSSNYEERRAQLKVITGENRHLDDMLPADQQLEVDLYQRLLDYCKAADPRAM